MFSTKREGRGRLQQTGAKRDSNKIKETKINRV